MTEEEEDKDQLYELLLPRLPFDVLGGALETFEVKLVEKKTEKGSHVLQGSYEEIEKVKDFIHQKLQEKVDKFKPG